MRGEGGFCLGTQGVIAGIGVDIIEIARVAAAARNKRFVDRLFTPEEIAQLPDGVGAEYRMAALFAAKEAVLKALGTGLAGHSWRQVEVLHRSSGAPYICLHGEAKKTAEDMGVSTVHISLSHDKERAVAFCIAEGAI